MSDLMDMFHEYNRAMRSDSEYRSFQRLFSQFVSDKYGLDFYPTHPRFNISKPKNIDYEFEAMLSERGGSVSPLYHSVADGKGEVLFRNESYLVCVTWLFTYLKEREG